MEPLTAWKTKWVWKALICCIRANFSSFELLFRWCMNDEDEIFLMTFRQQFFHSPSTAECWVRVFFHFFLYQNPSNLDFLNVVRLMLFTNFTHNSALTMNTSFLWRKQKFCNLQWQWNSRNRLDPECVDKVEMSFEFRVQKWRSYRRISTVDVGWCSYRSQHMWTSSFSTEKIEDCNSKRADNTSITMTKGLDFECTSNYIKLYRMTKLRYQFTNVECSTADWKFLLLV